MLNVYKNLSGPSISITAQLTMILKRAGRWHCFVLCEWRSLGPTEKISFISLSHISLAESRAPLNTQQPGDEGGPGDMDWQGQKLAEQLMQIMLVMFAVVAYIIGYLMGSFQNMLLIYAGGVVLTSLITVPNWPFFNRHPLNWLNPSEAEKHPKPQSANSNSKKKTTKK
ncbi:unnamed protein product [Ilex paraguariensis]|uniref:Signal peptidase complex subunit 1 n=1 Tax=Ilex paraguariensis TaxID=185542 RepID=A0ABC8TYK4_9AQUA